jgi:hypothetical protein
MAKNVFRTAQGKPIDMDALRTTNEKTIAVGNMKTNARGDELGPGGVVLRTRNEVVGEYYATNAVYTKERVEDQRGQQQVARSKAVAADPIEPVVSLDPAIDEQDHQMEDTAPKLRGTLADAVAKTAQVDQKVITPRRKAEGIKRI